MRHRLNWYYGSRNFVPPAVALTAPADGAVVGGAVTIAATASDADGVWSVGHSHDLAATFHNGPEPEPVPYDFVLDTERYADGPLTTAATAWDVQGNLGRSADRRLVVENRPPALRTWMNGPSQLTTETSAYLGRRADEPLARAECSLDGAPYTDCQDVAGAPVGERSWGGLGEGRHVLRILFTDMHGKRSVDPDAFWWVVDTKGVGVVAPSDGTAPAVTAPAPDIYTATPSATRPRRCGCRGRAATRRPACNGTTCT